MLSKFRLYTSYIALAASSFIFVWFAWHAIQRHQPWTSLMMLGLAITILSDIRPNGQYLRPVWKMKDFALVKSDTSKARKLFLWLGFTLLSIGIVGQIALAAGWSATLLAAVAMASCSGVPGRWRVASVLATCLLLLAAIFEYGSVPRGV